MDVLPKRSQIKIGDNVLIETKVDQGTGKLTDGIVAEILTSGESHPHGIMVKLKDEQIGRVKAIGSPDKSTASKNNSIGFVDLDKIEIPNTENKNHEFKEFYQYDEALENIGKENNSAIESIRLKSQGVIAMVICSFGNSQDGGFLYIGIDSDGIVQGLERDKGFGGFSDYTDSFANHLRDRVGEMIGDKVFMTSKIQIKFRDIDGKTICIIQILPSEVPLWLHIKSDREFYVRGAIPRAEKLNDQEQYRYIRERFPDYK